MYLTTVNLPFSTSPWGGGVLGLQSTTETSARELGAAIRSTGYGASIYLVAPVTHDDHLPHFFKGRLPLATL